ncbi:HAD family phosphatase [Nocardia farcinica]|uniref:Phosphorylated carbohydrates phosphatase TM_1254 n=3 Tax=Nocardia farcinica TaxID=37329 RepID=A0A0H5NFN3_NOCFR|nr:MULTISPECIES: HAD family phosphatase [Nocardia]AXK84393.1 HAD family phosphatase [Nocardia farcinica]MBF6069665.1 HAD family phosphatase [Nocardia farcinica]MBF6139171.1 HAD family phosphatase [Nocardia farcinica]MBF6183747.1 HAD family phosphatase [Nocardia farcinica]MBF6232884.1 HAD family phosphatase [Nocardia farcinica]
MTGRLAAVLWDMDGTLLDSEKLWDIAVRELAVELGTEMTDEVRHALVGASGPNALRILFDGLGVDPTTEALREAADFLERRVGDLMTGPIPWRPGAADALALVRAAGLPSALVTNTIRSLTEFGLDTLGRHHFDVSVCGDEVAEGKPAPDPYLRAAELLGVDPRHCVAVEDSPTGARAATAAGCAVIVVPCEVPVPDGPGRVLRESLIGLTVDHLHQALRRVA